MRILFFGNNWLGWQIARWLGEHGEHVVGAVLHPTPRRRYGARIEAVLQARSIPVVEAPALVEVATLRALSDLQPEIGVSAMFGYILRPEVLELMPRGCVNVHLGLLPYNRGAYPNVWSIVDGTPAGVTVHYMDPGIDTGDIIARRETAASPFDTGQTLYERLERDALALFAEAWPRIRAGDAPRLAQDPAVGTTHRTRDVERIDRIRLDEPCTARALIDVIRARTFPPHAGAYFEQDGHTVYLRLQLLSEADLEAEKVRGDADAD